MSTTLQDAIIRIGQDYLNRSTLDSKIVRAIQAAVRHYERQRFPWNETATALATVALTESVPIPADFLVLDLLEVTFGGSKYELKPRSFKEIRQFNAVPGAEALPSFYCLHGNNFLLSPIPDVSYPITCNYLQQLPQLTSNALTATNDWLSAAEDVIIYHATKLMWANVLRNTDEATKYAQLERDAYTELTTYNEQRNHRAIR